MKGFNIGFSVVLTTFPICVHHEHLGNSLMWQIGIIGGSGLDNPVLLENRREKEVDTPFGKVSLPLFIETCASFLFGPLSQAANRQSLAFRHLFPNSARFGYTTEGSVFISTQMSTNAVSTLWKAWVLFYKQDCENYVTLKHACKHEAHLPRVKKKEESSVSTETILVLFMLV